MAVEVARTLQGLSTMYTWALGTILDQFGPSNNEQESKNGPPKPVKIQTINFLAIWTTQMAVEVARTLQGLSTKYTWATGTFWTNLVQATVSKSLKTAPQNLRKSKLSTSE